MGKNLIAVIDEDDCLTILTKDEEQRFLPLDHPIPEAEYKEFFYVRQEKLAVDLEVTKDWHEKNVRVEIYIEDKL